LEYVLRTVVVSGSGGIEETSA